MTELVEFPKRTLAHTVYKNSKGEIVPSVTTVLNVLNKPALIKWANNLGLQGIDSTKYVDKLAGIGTLAHYLIECYLKKEEPDLSEFSPDDVKKAQVAVEKYLKWEKEYKPEPILIEQPLVSDEFNYGGQIDLVAKLNNKVTLIDFKTCKAIYPEMMYQLAAYKNLLLNTGQHVDEAIILRIGRDESEGFEVRHAGDLKNEWLIFESCLKIYHLKQKLEK